MNYKALIFDMDGTLLDTLPAIIKACNETFASFGYQISFTKEDGKYFIGAGSEEFTRRALARANIEGLDVFEFRKVFLKNYSIYQKNETTPFIGLKNCLLKLKNNGYLVGICSNKPQNLLTEIVEQMFNEVPFDIVVGQREGIPCKPHPEMLNIVMNNLGLKKKDVLYIGDSEYDYKFANNSKVDCCLVTYGYGIYTDEFVNNVTYKVGTVEELQNLLIK